MSSSGRAEADRSGWSDAELIGAIQKGDLRAFTALVGRFQGSLINFFFHQSWDRQTAEDCAQEVFLKLYEKLDSYEPRAKFSTFLFRVARNLWIDRVRAAGGRVARISLEAAVGQEDRGGLRDRLAGPGETPVEALSRQETRRSLRTAIDRLSEEQRMVVLLSEFHGLRYQEIGEVLGIPVGTVKSRMHAAVENLREMLTDHEL